MSPAVLKTLSAGTLVAGMDRYLFAKADSSGRSTCSLHHCNTSPSKPKVSFSLYFKISSLAFSLMVLHSGNLQTSGPWQSFSLVGHHLQKRAEERLISCAKNIPFIYNLKITILNLHYILLNLYIFGIVSISTNLSCPLWKGFCRLLFQVSGPLPMCLLPGLHSALLCH